MAETPPTGASVSIFSFSTSSGLLSVYTTDEAQVGLFKVYLTGTLNNGQVYTTTFYLTVLSQCYWATVTAQASTIPTYFVNSGTVNTSLISFTRNNTNCALTYTLKNSDGTTIDTSLITFSSSPLQISVATTNTAKVGIYNLILSAAYSSGTNTVS